MTDHDDHDGGDGDVPQLQSLRAAWLSMPDEEPPQRGLAELMAAARVKAEEMAKPSLWQRIVATLRRPPVLALATVMVLVGGGVLIGRRGDAIEAQPEAISSRQTTAAAPAAGSAAPTEGAPMLAEPVPPPAPAAPAGGPADDRTEEQPSVTRRALAPKAEPTKVAAEKKKAPAKAAPRPSTLKAAKQEVYRDDDAPTLQDSTRGMDAESPSFESQIVVGGRGAAPPPAETTSQAPSADASPRGGASSGAPASRVSQYLTNAKSAAARGDCATAQAWLKRLASEDAAAHRKAVASDAALKKCVVAQ